MVLAYIQAQHRPRFRHLPCELPLGEVQRCMDELATAGSSRPPLGQPRAGCLYFGLLSADGGGLEGGGEPEGCLGGGCIFDPSPEPL
jgi:hypothetical protein